MPQVGEIQRGVEINKIGTARCHKYRKYIWLACLDCGKQRWVSLRKGEPQYLRCSSCAKKGLRTGAEHPLWKGGRTRSEGYIRVWLSPDDFFYPMANRGYVLEHRLVVAKALGRCLQSWEIVHHKDNCPKDDNRYPETLQLVTDDRHKQITILETKIQRLEKRVTLLEADNILLREQLNPRSQRVVE